MLSWGTSDVVSAKVYRIIGSLKGVLFSQFLGIPLLLLLLPLESHRGAVNLWPIFLLGMADAGVWWLFSYAARVGNIAIVGPVFQTSFVTSVILGIIFLGEAVTFNKLVGGIFVLVGVILLSLKLNSIKKDQEGGVYKGVLPAALAAVGAGTYLFLLAPLVRSNGWVNTTIIVRSGIASSTLLFSLFRRDLKGFRWLRAPWKLIILMAFLDQFALVTYNFAVRTLEVSVVSIIVSASTLVTVILGAVFLKDRLNLVQKAGALSVVVGLIGLNL